MAENTAIEWADHTFNPWTGCTKIGPGCDHCYAEGWAKRSGIVQWGSGAERRRTSAANWRQPLRWNAQAQRLGIRYRVFCASLADVFDNAVPAQWRAELFDLISRTPHLDWLLVTKRIGNAKTMMADALHRNPAALSDGRIWPLPNVWLGITVVNQAEADRDIMKLLDTPAAVRFLSMEPLLGPVDLTDVCHNRGSVTEDHFSALFDPDDDVNDDGTPFSYVDWVIVGAESGPHARPMHPQWARDIRDQCQAAGVPFMHKQNGEWISGKFDRRKGKMICDPTPERPAGRIFWTNKGAPKVHLWDKADHYWTHASARIGKKAAGRLLDGREHNEIPAVVSAKPRT